MIILSKKLKLVLALLVIAIGAFELGFGIKFLWVWWLTPNLTDGVLTILAGLLLIAIGSRYGFRLLPIGEEIN